MELAKVFKALSDEKRLIILREISEKQKNNGQLCACDILEIEGLGFTQPTCSHHMSILVNSGLVNVEKCGKYNYYVLNKEVFQELEKTIGEFINVSV